ncbi:MAG TPA: alkaline phosphatase family protein [Thermoanaerobaculia bacterium]|jgi:hypothetical protein
MRFLRRPVLAVLVVPAVLFLFLSASHPAPRRVLLLSLDGASAHELHRLQNEGAFAAGGLARFFAEGEVAERLIPVNPALTAPNHISLAAGYPASRTGIVANVFHRPGTPFLETVSGFAAPIETETLWEAARRQGKRAGVMTWPGADDIAPRRRGDWGMVYVNDPDREAELVALKKEDWKPVSAPDVDSRSPVRSARITIGTQTFDLFAVDRSDDGTVNYDGVVIAQDRTPVSTGAWRDVPCRPATGCAVKLLQLAPDLATARLYFGGLYTFKAYPQSFAAALGAHGLTWPGPPDDQRLNDSWAGRPGIDLETWVQQEERFAHFFGDSLLAAAQRPDWDLLMGYMPVIDEAGHQLTLTDPHQPGFSAARRDELAAARRRVWQAVDRELARLLAALDLRTTVAAVVSDHGMAPVHTLLDPNVLLREQGLLAADAAGEVLEAGTSAYAVGSGGVSHVYIAPGKGDLLARLRRLFADWKVDGARPVERIFDRSDAKDAGLDHANSGDLILFFREGYSARGGLLKEGRASAPADVLGMHGYFNAHPSVHGIYMALGAGIARGNAGTVRNPEVAGRVAGWLGIEKPRPAP